MITIINRNGEGGMTWGRSTNAGALIMTSATVPDLVTSATLVGTTITSAQSPFAGGGNSYLLNGTSNYMYVPAGTNWVMGTGDFTIEWFQYMTSQPSNPRVFSIGTYPSATWAVSIEGGTLYHWEANGFRFSNVLSTPYLNTWIHFAISRISNQTKVFRNGTQIGSTYGDSNNINNSITRLVIGQEALGNAANSYFPGYLTNIRIVKGLGVYTGNFTKPTSTLTAIASANPYGGSNTVAIADGFTKLLLVP